MIALTAVIQSERGVEYTHMGSHTDLLTAMDVALRVRGMHRDNFDSATMPTVTGSKYLFQFWESVPGTTDFQPVWETSLVGPGGGRQ